MSVLKKCPNGHFYKGNACPYCVTDFMWHRDSGPPYKCANCGECSAEYNEGKCPYCGSRLQSLGFAYPSWFPSDLTTIVPVCKQCGHRIRRTVPSSNGLVSYVLDSSEKVTPWNYKWDGKCEFCGFDYNVHTKVKIEEGQYKVTSVCIDTCGVVDEGTCDQLTVFSGVTIRTSIGGKNQGEVFLSANEVKYLLDAIKESPLLEQFDYHFDGT